MALNNCEYMVCKGVLPIYLLLLLVLATNCELILLGGVRECDLEAEDLALNLALDHLQTCLGNQTDLPSVCPTFAKTDNISSIELCGNFTSCDYQIVAGVTYHLTFNTTIGIVEYKAYVRYWELNESKRVQLSLKILQLYPEEINCPDLSQPTPQPPTNTTITLPQND